MRNNIFFLLILSLFLISCDEIDVISSGETEVKEETIESELENEVIETEEPESSTENTTEQLEQLSVHYIDVGQGDATLFEFTDGNDPYTILYDVGDWQGNEVVPYLQSKKIDYIDLIIISHPHADHIGQLHKVIDAIDVGEVWMSGNLANTNIYQEAMEAVLDNDIDYDEPTAGDVFDIGSLQLSVLHPAELTGKLNEDSLSLRFTYGTTSFLFTGDAYVNEELSMIQQTNNIQADFLQLGHHGSNTSSDPSFVDAVDPKYAIYSAGKGNTYGHPHEEVVSLFAKKDIPLYGTDVHGTIVVTTDGIDTNIATEKDGKVKGNKDAVTEQKESKKQKKVNQSDCININDASAEELQQIIHIGEARAIELIDNRPFEAVDDLTSMSGIGPARIADIIEEGKACTGGD